MAEEDRSFNYNDLNLDFLEISPPRAIPLVRNVTPIPSSSFIRANAFKAKQLSQKVIQTDVLVNKIHRLGGENTAMKQKLKDFQKSASQIQELYESEKQKSSSLQIQLKKVEVNSTKLQTRCTQLHNDLEEKKLQLEQLQAQMDEDKGPLSYTGLALKYLKLFQQLDEEDVFSNQEKSLHSELSKYCEERGCKSALLRLVKVKKKRSCKKSKEVLLGTALRTNPKEYKTQSTQTSITTCNSTYTQTAVLPFPRDMQTQTIATEELKPLKTLLTQAVQTTPIALRSQGTQHISITTTRGTSTSCFIKKHNVGTCFPEPIFVPPVTVMVEELLQLYSVSPLSPIADPLPLPATTSNELQDVLPPSPLISQKEPVTYKSIGTCTYLCNVQRQIDFIPINSTFKRSQSSSPSPACACLSIKNETFNTPTPSPPPLPSALQNSTPPLSLRVSAAGSHNNSTAEPSAPLNDNFDNMPPMLNSFSQLPEMQPEVFSTIWQMAGQMFMGLLYAPTNNRIRTTHLNTSNNSIDQQQFNNWLHTLYESMQQPPQQAPTVETSTDIRQSEYQQNSNRSEITDLNSETNSMNLSYSNNSTSQQEEEIFNVSTNESTNSIETDRSSLPSETMNSSQNLPDCIFKEPLEIPKRSVKQSRKRKTTETELRNKKKYRGKQIRKKRKKDKQNKLSEISNLHYSEQNEIAGQRYKESTVEVNTSQQDELDFSTAVEFCAKLCSFNNGAKGQTNQNEANGNIGTIQARTENAPQKLDLSCGAIEYDKNTVVNKIGQSESNGCSLLEDETNLRVDLINDNFKDNYENVPELKLSGTAKNKCDNLDNIETVNSAVPQSASNIIADTAYRIPVERESSVKQIKHAVNSLFGSDTEDEDIDEELEKDKNKSGHGDSSKTPLKGPSSLLNSTKINKDVKSLEIFNDTQNKAKNLSSEPTSLQVKTETNRKVKNSLPSTLLNQNEMLVENEENNSVEQILLDLSMSESEDEEIEKSSIVKPTNNVNTEICEDESEEADEAVLVIDEKDLEDNHRKRTASESSIVSNMSSKISNSLSPTKSVKETCSDTDISALLENTVVEDLLANTTAQQLYKSILKESANKVNEELDTTTSPRNRGRKRKHESVDFELCKPSTGLRVDLKYDSDSSNDESLLPPSKIYTDKMLQINNLTTITNDIYSRLIMQPNKKLLNVTKQEIENYQSQYEAVDKVFNKSESQNVHDKCITNEITEKTFSAYDVPDKVIEASAVSLLNTNTHSNTVHASPSTSSEHSSSISLLNFPASSSELIEPSSKNYQTLRNQRNCDLFASPLNINNNYVSPASPPSIHHNYYESPLSPSSLTNVIFDQDQCSATQMELKRCSVPSAEYYQSRHNESYCESLSSAAHVKQNEYESPISPQPLFTTANNIGHTTQCQEIPLELNRDYFPVQRRSILQHIINNYSADIYTTVTGKAKGLAMDCKIALQLQTFLNTTKDRVDMLASTLALTLHEEIDDTEMIASVIVDQLMNAPRPNTELNCELASVPPKYIGTHLRLISIMLRHLQYKRPDVGGVLLAKIENKLFNYQNNENMKLEAALNLTQLYLLVIPMHKAAEYNPARLFIAKSLYYYNVLAHPIIYEVLIWYPTTLPSREEKNYDRSDALITVIQHFLMCTTYNMDTKDLRHKELLSLLRFEYHFEPFKPKALEVLSNLVSKLKAGHLSNLKYAFAIFCKRHTKLVDILLQQQLLPLADEYYKLVQNTNEYDERIAALIDCISSVVKPLALDTDVSLYHSIFERFLVAVQRPAVQEAAVLAILRLQRFGQTRCFHALAHFRPHYTLQLLTSNSLKTFIHKKPFSYWKSLLLQNK